jgi:hypothetical protein
MAEHMKTSCSINPCLPKRYLPFIIFIILAVQTLGCSFKVRLVGEYDEITDQAVTELYKKTKGFFLKLQRASGQEASYEENKGFYEEVQGDIAVLILRAEITEENLKRNPLTQNFKDLQEQYDDLELLHKTMPNKKALQSAEEALDRSFRAIVENLLYLKWNQGKTHSTKQ